MTNCSESNIVLYRLLSDARATCNDGNVVSYTLRVYYSVVWRVNTGLCDAPSAVV